MGRICAAFYLPLIGVRKNKARQQKEQAYRQISVPEEAVNQLRGTVAAEIPGAGVEQHYIIGSKKSNARQCG